MAVGPSTTAVYMMASRRHGTIYIGVTGGFIPRIVEHREGLREGFTKRYGVKRLVWYEMHDSIVTAIPREKTLKKYRRDWKINLIERVNPIGKTSFRALSPSTASFRTSYRVSARFDFTFQTVMAGLVPATHEHLVAQILARRRLGPVEPIRS